MSRISRRSATEAAEALLEVGRTQPALNYDVELGLARHQDCLRSEAPMPEWASASTVTAGKSLLAVVIKTLVSSVLIGALAAAAWYARGGQQPSAADVLPRAERAPGAVANVPEGSAIEAEARTAHMPIPVPEQALPVEPAVRPPLREKRVTFSPRARKDSAAARTASARADTVPLTSAPVEVAATPSSAERATRHEVAARESISARQEHAPRVQAPDDLVEMQQVASAEQLLERAPERALLLVRQGDQRFARGYFQQERAYIAIMALIRLGRIEEARVRAASFAKRFPVLPYGARIRSALAAVAPQGDANP